ncbi:MAG TPA: hypothetical protein VKR30_00475 [Candidatus Limnocylindrales bacterium]|nr:hypothetical protein [Candidatus Limnocylindrales bacterium]
MASHSTTDTSTRRAASDGRSSVIDARAALRDLGEAMPDVARVSRGLVTDAMRAIERGSDDRLTAGATLSLGLAIGLLIGGAPRLLIVMALTPAAAIGLQIVDRQRGRRSHTSSTT